MAKDIVCKRCGRFCSPTEIPVIRGTRSDRCASCQPEAIGMRKGLSPDRIAAQCTRLKRYPDRDAAIRAATANALRWVGQRLEPRDCSLCNGYHLKNTSRVDRAAG